MKKIARIIVINIVCALVLFEASLQWIASRPKDSHPAILEIQEMIKPTAFWEQYFLLQYMRGEMVYAGIHEPHATRGWSMKPSKSSVRQSILYRSNSQGFRANHDYRNQEDKFNVVIVGDSFTFGDEINLEDTWPYLLASEHPDWNVMNIAGTGYGLDQMLITLQEEVPLLKPDFIITAFIDNDLPRAMVSFRDFKKPRFKISKGQLVMDQPATGEIDDVIDDISMHSTVWYSKIQSLNLLHNLSTGLSAIRTSCESDCFLLNARIIQEMQALSTQSGAGFAVLYLPWSQEIFDPAYKSYGEEFIENHLLTEGIHVINPRSSLLNATFHKALGHYRRNENIIVSQEVSRALGAVPGSQKQ